MMAIDLWRLNPDIPNENKWNLIRQYRNELLTKCDWTQLKDCPLSPEKVTEYEVYRQALRDITDTFTNPDEVIFPNEP